MTTIVSINTFLIEPEKEYGEIDTIIVNHDMNKSLTFCDIETKTCKHMEITVPNLKWIEAESLQTLILHIHGCCGRKDRFGINVEDITLKLYTPNIISLSILIESLYHDFFSQFPSLNDQNTETGILIRTTSIRNLYFPSVEKVLMKGICFQPDFVSQESFPLAFRYETIRYEHCIFFPTLLHQNSTGVTFHHCYLLLGEHKDKYHLLHITHDDNEWMHHKLMMASTLLSIHTNAFPTRMVDHSKSKR